ncbi:PI3K/PI4K domain-containing protein [Abeliophyllum distichum]|uniref:PI3K/PI4K domain-containing protein n=1 Tax=Abeliophyllum distichum TaxID=126358 RepID=A0ABD1P8J9_9LAMI
MRMKLSGRRKSAVSLMKRQVNELKEALLKTSLEIVQMEWMHDITLTPLQNTKLTSLKILADDDLLKVISNISRPNLLENIQSSIAKIAKSLECLHSCEQTSITAEGQLERAMSWACGGPKFHVKYVSPKFRNTS